MSLLRAMVGLAFTYSFRKTSASLAWMCMFVLLRVGFFGLLRPTEVVNLRARDVSLPEPSEAEGVLVIGLHDPKNRLFMGRNQFAPIRDEACIVWTRWMTRGFPCSCKLWPGSVIRFRMMFARLLSDLEFSSHRFSPGFLRPGETTWEFMRGVPLSQLKFAGWWDAGSSLAVYVQEAMAHRVWNDLSSRERELLRVWEAQTQHIWEGPPIDPHGLASSREDGNMCSCRPNHQHPDEFTSPVSRPMLLPSGT